MLLILVLMGYGVGIALVVTGLVLALRRAKASTSILLLLLGVWSLTDLTLWSAGKPPLSNRALRFAAGAPAIHVSHQLLMYQGRVPVASLSPWKPSDEGVALLIAPVYAETAPPWAYLYVPAGEGRYFRYARPKARPWRY